MLACAEALSDACRQALEATVDEPTMARAAGRTLGLDKTIAWKLVRIAYATDPGEVFGVLPGPRGWTRVYAAVDATEIGASATEPLRRAVDALDAEASARGIARSRIRSWSAGATPTPTDRGASEVERVRERLTKANTAIWGIGGNAIFRTIVARPADEPGQFRIATVTTLHGLHRTRPGPEWPIHRAVRVQDGERADLTTIDCTDLCSPGSLDDAGLVEGRAGLFRTFRGDRTGPSDRVDLVFAEVLTPTTSMFAAIKNGQVELELPIRVPATLAVIDAFVHDDLPWPKAPQHWAYSDIGAIPMPVAHQPLHRMPMTERVEEPSRIHPDDLAPTAPAISEDARNAHATAIQRVLETIECDAADFTRHRLRVSHPALSSSIRMAWPTTQRS